MKLIKTIEVNENLQVHIGVNLNPDFSVEEVLFFKVSELKENKVVRSFHIAEVLELLFAGALDSYLDGINWREEYDNSLPF